MILLNCLLGPTSGNITIDNIPRSSIPKEIVRDRIIILPQTPFFFPHGATVREHLEHIPIGHDPVPADPTDEASKAALEAVGLWDSISSKGALDAEWTAAALSQGQKQLFSLARVVYRVSGQPKQGAGGVLLLDEFNSAADADCDRLMQSSSVSLRVIRSFVWRAHRLYTVMD